MPSSNRPSAEEIRDYVADAFGVCWVDRDGLVREANNRWAPAEVIDALMNVPNRYYRSIEDLDTHLCA